MVTQCPACGSRFRINESQLGRAGGRVRCGACLEIFLAPDSLSGDEETAPRAAGGTGGTEGREVVGEGAGSGQPGEQAANVRKGSGEDCPGATEPQLARGGPGASLWVRWALVVAVLILFLQFVQYLA